MKQPHKKFLKYVIVQRMDGGGYAVTVNVGCQFFRVETGGVSSLKSAYWWRTQIAHALAMLVDAEAGK